MNRIEVLGLNHKTAPISTREKLVFSPFQVKDVLCLLQKEGISEAVVLSTCNRTEFYLVAEEGVSGRETAVSLLGRYCDLSAEDFEPYLYDYRDGEAVRHLFEVSAGLDSLVVGETQVLGQVKEAYQLSIEHGGAGSILHGLFQQAFTAGKRVHRETGINDNAASVSYAAVELARQICGNLRGKTILLIGAGKMSELAAKHLFESGTASLVVINRSEQRGAELAAKFGEKAFPAPYDRLREKLAEADIVISSTAAPHLIIYREAVEEALVKRGARPLLFIDIAVPRDIESSVGELKTVHLYNIDRLESVVQGNMQKRREEAERARKIIAAEVDSFMEWCRTREVVPVIAALRQKADRTRRAELEKYHKKLQQLSPKERQLVEKISQSLVNGILRDPMLVLKDSAREEEAELYKQVLSRLFNLEDGNDGGGQERRHGSVPGGAPENKPAAETRRRDETTGGRGCDT